MVKTLAFELEFVVISSRFRPNSQKKSINSSKQTMNNTKQYAMDAEPISVIGEGNYIHQHQTGHVEIQEKDEREVRGKRGEGGREKGMEGGKKKGKEMQGEEGEEGCDTVIA
ncbi:hypothetical protein ACROYT_G006813 [Oculina patagonica]